MVEVVRRRRGEMAFPLIAGTGVLVAYALGEGNFGTAYRHLGELVSAVALAAVTGAAAIRERLARGPS